MTLADKLRATMRDWLGIKAPTYPGWFADESGADIGLPYLYDQRAQAMTYTWSSWVVSALNMVAQTIKTPTLHVLKAKGEKETEVEAHPLELLFARPNPIRSGSDFREAMINWRLLTGNCYVWLNRASETAPPDELWILPSYEVRPHPDGRLSIDGYAYTPTGAAEPQFLPKWQIMHWHGFSPSTPFAGSSFVQVLNSTINTDHAQAMWNERNFSKEQGKAPGILAFPDFISDPLWSKMQAEFYADKQGARRHVMLMRGTGASTPKWVSTYMSPAEMEFLDSRRWNREEIYSVLAPGLHTMLSENSTEANSRVGKEVFATYCWGLLDSLAQQMQGDLLPAYGDDLKAEFEDIRVVDKAMELAEQTAFAITHTVDEIREKFYQDKALGDERGLLLPAQISPTTKMPGDEPGPVPVALQEAQGQPLQPAQEQGPQGASSEGPQANQAQAQRAMIEADLHKWRRKAKRRGVFDFESDAIPDWQQEAIKARLETNLETAFDPFLKATGLQARLERKLLRALSGIYDQYRPMIEAAVAAGNAPDLSEMYAQIRSEAELIYHEAMTDELLGQAAELAWGIDYEDALDAAQEYAQREAERLIGQISQTDAKYLAKLAAQVAEGKLTPEAMAEMLASVFGANRAETISITETTRALQAVSDKLQRDLKESGIETIQRWLTAEDERVCPVCGPLDHTVEDTWRETMPDGPPAHVRCRCRTVVETIKRRRR